jgi:hypothetical protein
MGSESVSKCSESGAGGVHTLNGRASVYLQLSLSPYLHLWPPGIGWLGQQCRVALLREKTARPEQINPPTLTSAWAAMCLGCWGR